MKLKKVNTLSTEEAARLAELEPVIESGLGTFREVGFALGEICDKRLYRATHSTFNDYIEDRWKISKVHAYRMIDAAQVIKLLPEKSNQLVTNEAQARELAKVEPEKREAVLESAVKAAKAKGRKITAKDVRKAAKPEGKLKPEPKVKPLEVRAEAAYHHMMDGFSVAEIPKVRNWLRDWLKPTETHDGYTATS